MSIFSKLHQLKAALLNREVTKQKRIRKPGFDYGYWAARARKATGLRTYRIVGEDHSPAWHQLTDTMAKYKKIHGKNRKSGRYFGELQSMIWGCA